MKKDIIGKIAACAVAFAAVGAARAEFKGETVNGYTWIYEEEGGESFIVGITSNPSGTLTFPAELGGKPVRNLYGHSWVSFAKFQWQEADWYDEGGYWQRVWDVSDDWLSGVTGVVIPEGVTNICDRAFASDDWTDDSTGERYRFGWYNLKSVTIPDSLLSCNICLTSWDNAFYGTPFLRSKKFPDFILNKSGTKLWGVKAYEGEWDYDVCRDAVVPASVTEIADNALCTFGAYGKYEYGDGSEGYGLSVFGEGYVRIVFEGTKPKASKLTFAREKNAHILFSKSR